MQALHAIRVVELGNFITAPYAAMLLGEFGADVVKVERPDGGDPFRSFKGGQYSPHFQAHNRHKRSLALDVNAPAGREVLDRLLAGADVLLLNTRPGALQRMGLDWEQVHARHPRLVHCAITGFGPDGPYAERPAFDNVGQALSGWMSRFRTGDDPRVVGPAVSDAATGLFAALGILNALYARAQDGIGRRVDVSMLECTVALALEPLGQFLATRQPVPVFQRAAMSQAYTVTCADGRRIGLHLSSPDKFWVSLCQALERPQWAERYPRRQDRVECYEQIAADLNGVFAGRDRAAWLRILEQADVPHAPELELQELEDDPQVRHLDLFHTCTHPVLGPSRGLRRAVRIDGERDPAQLPPPALGEHGPQLLQELGFEPEAIESLLAQGIVGRAR
jgi:crotonobetainyl-CoA:carnitine CoA-transferase CaiB-like acyl-CoA transferase